MNILISGGCKNGKSSIAENCCVALAKGGPLYYLATMKAYDQEDRDRIARHVKMRDGKGFFTIEQPTQILHALDQVDAADGTFILDSITALIINELYLPDGTVDSEAPERVAAELIELTRHVKHVVMVSDYIYSEIDNYSDYTEAFLQALATVDKALAAHCDVVAEVALGNPILYKGELPV